MNAKKSTSTTALAVTVKGNALLLEGEVILEVCDNSDAWGDPAAPVLGARWMGAAINHFPAMAATLEEGRTLADTWPLGSEERRKKVAELYTRTRATLNLLRQVAPVPPFAMPLREVDSTTHGTLEGSEVFGWKGFTDQVAYYASPVAPDLRSHILQAANSHLPLRQALCAQAWACQTEIKGYASTDRAQAALAKYVAVEDRLNALGRERLAETRRWAENTLNFRDTVSEWSRVRKFWGATLPRRKLHAT
jgi:hypothetical protein